MAKSPRKSGSPVAKGAKKSVPKKAPLGKKPIASKSVSYKSNPLAYAPKVGGKNLKDYDFFQKRRRRLSLASSSSESSDGLAGNSNDTSHLLPSDSDTESSLTAMSEQDETAASRKGSVFFKRPQKHVRGGKSTKAAKAAKATKTSRSARKSLAGKQLYESADLDDDFYGNESDASAEHGIYSIGAETFAAASSSESENSADESVNDSQNDTSSSSDDEGIDFVQLQSERRKNFASKGLPKSGEKKRRNSLKYRKRSTVAIPEDVNFKFEFDNAVSESELENPAKPEEEDVGEEVPGAEPVMDFHFDEPLIEVPKFKDEELVSDDDYDYDDNDLLATLQADNDLDEFINVEAPTPKTRQNSMSSLNEEGEDAFLKEEEKYLVSHFETNGFDEDELDPTRKETARVMDSFNEMDSSATQQKKVLQYASSDDNGFSDHDYDGEDDGEDDYVDFIDFDKPFSEGGTEVLPIRSKEPAKKARRPLQKPKSKRRRAHDSEDEDDSYLWNYFFSSDAESSGESEAEQYDADEQLVLEEIFRQNLEQRRQEMERESSKEPAETQGENEYEAGESTDEDETLPTASGPTVGSKVAKEVLSSKTADYRPPVLGIWAAVDSKPFGIIDGLSTRTLQQNSGKKQKGWRNFSFKNNSEGSAIELDELLNISELDNDDENDVRIWRDFNNNKKHVPLGAFRNKNHTPMVVAEPMGYGKLNGNYNGKRRNSSQQLKAKLANNNASASLSKDLNLPSKSKLRRASIADAVSEGYRPTKAGLYSENVLADVEEVLGEDPEFVALIKGL